MKEHLNFYENIDEARIRLRNTLVCYDGEPYKIFALANHKDGIIRVYMRAIAVPINEKEFPSHVLNSWHPDDAGFAPAMDQWLETPEGKRSGFVCKMMNSPKFNKYRPFPLGMCNYSKGCVYIERMPNRKTEQGLILSMTAQTPVTVTPTSSGGIRMQTIDIFTPEFHDCVVGNYPSPEKCLINLKDPDVINTAAAFHREFALARGPMNMIFLAYRDEIIGLLPDGSFNLVRLGSDFGYTKEVVAELNLFKDIQL